MLSKNYKNLFKKKIDFTSALFTNGKIIISEGKDYVATINKANLSLKFVEDTTEAKLKGKFLNDSIYINLNNKKIDDKILTNILFKMLNANLVTKANLNSFINKPDLINGNILINLNNNRLAATFDYENNEFLIKDTKVKNSLLEGEMTGKIKLLPYFDFDLDLVLKNLNFTKLCNNFLSLKEKGKIFKINNKINGKLHVSADKIYSKNNLAKSFESRVKFNNGNILINQFLINLGKLGAADMSGEILNEKNLSNLKFESNIFVDNEKKFISKFGIYKKENISPNFFIDGSISLDNPKMTIYEIFDNKNFNNEDVNYIEQTFNEIMFENNFETLFKFDRFKNFIKLITDTSS